jgi:predicted Zn-dependent protease
MVNNAPILRDRAAEQRVSDILSKLFDATPTTGHWTVTLIDAPEFNAMTVPGNHIFVFRGLLDGAANDDEVAVVLAHEIAHRLAQHELKTSEEKWGAAIAALATVAAGVAVASQEGSTEQDVNEIMESTLQLGAGFTTLRYSRDKEREADQIGLFILADAGFNPNTAVTLWGKRAAAEGSGGSDFFSTHPLPEDRQTMAAQLLPLAQARYQNALTKHRTAEPTKRSNPLNAEVVQHLREAEDALARRDLNTASALAQSLTARAPSSPEVYDVLGRVKAVLGEPKQAYKAFKKGLKLAPDNPTLTYNLGCSQALQGEKAAALKSLEKAFTLDPTLAKHAETDPDLVNLYNEPEFKRLLAREYVATAPANVGGNSFSIN